MKNIDKIQFSIVNEMPKPEIKLVPGSFFLLTDRQSKPTALYSVNEKGSFIKICNEIPLFINKAFYDYFQILDSESKSTKGKDSQILAEVQEGDYALFHAILGERDAITGVFFAKEVSEEISKLKIQINALKNAKKLKTIPTQADGNCGYHSILGERKFNGGALICPDMDAKKNLVKNKILNENNIDEFNKLLKEAIIELIMSTRSDIGHQLIKLRGCYQRHLQQQKTLNEDIWGAFEHILKSPENKVIEAYISTNTENFPNLNFKEKFYMALNSKEGELYGRIMSLPALSESFKIFNFLQDQSFDWDQNITPIIIKTYAEYMSKSILWLLPAELAIVGYVFNKTVVFYPLAGANPIIYNSGQKSEVSVQFNGTNHYERLEPQDHDLKDDTKSLQGFFYKKIHEYVTKDSEINSQEFPRLYLIKENYKKLRINPAEFNFYLDTEALSEYVRYYLGENEQSRSLICSDIELAAFTLGMSIHVYENMSTSYKEINPGKTKIVKLKINNSKIYRIVDSAETALQRLKTLIVDYDKKFKESSSINLSPSSEQDDGDEMDMDNYFEYIPVNKVKRQKISKLSYLPIDGGIYTGTNTELKRNGFGVYDKLPQYYFMGGWSDDKEHGQGYQLSNNGETNYYGRFEYGSFQNGYGRKEIQKGVITCVYDGRFKKGQFHGLGELEIKNLNSIKIIAKWKQGKAKIIYDNQLKKLLTGCEFVFFKELSKHTNDTKTQSIQHALLFELIKLIERKPVKFLKSLAEESKIPSDLQTAVRNLHEISEINIMMDDLLFFKIKESEVESYIAKVADICLIGLDLYLSSRLGYELQQNANISVKQVFGDSLDTVGIADCKRNEPAIQALSKYKKLLQVVPGAIDLIKNLINIANAQSVAMESKTKFTQETTKELQEIWKYYINQKDKHLHDQFDFHSDFYQACFWMRLQLQYNLLYIKTSSSGYMLKMLEKILEINPLDNQAKSKLAKRFSTDNFSLKDIITNFFMIMIKENLTLSRYEVLKNFISDYYQKRLSVQKVLFEELLKGILTIFEYLESLHIYKDHALVEIQIKSLQNYCNQGQKIFIVFENFSIYNQNYCDLVYFFSESSLRYFNDSPDKDIINTIKNLSMTYVYQEKPMEVEEGMIFLQNLNNFMVSLRNIDWSWIIEEQKYLSETIDLQKLNNNKILISFESISKKFQIFKHCPHYTYNIICKLLQLLEKQKFKTAKHASILLEAIRESLKFLSDQLYCDNLKVFEKESIHPFETALHDEKYLENNIKNINIYFLFNRKLNQITLEKSIMLLQNENYSSLDSKKNEIEYSSLKIAMENRKEDPIKKISDCENKSYETVFEFYLNALMNFDPQVTIANIIKQTRILAEKFQKKNGIDHSDCKLRMQIIPPVIAGLAIILSCRVSNSLEYDNKEWKIKKTIKGQVFLKPHRIQILGVLLLLGIGSTQKGIDNHLGEIKTGQGKSWALTLLAGFFCLIGYKVKIACYSEYLIDRDKHAFLHNTRPFDFKVTFNTFKAICEEKFRYNSDFTFSDALRSLLSGKPITISEEKGENSIILMDEADVFIDQIEMQRGFLILEPSPSLRDLQMEIWLKLVEESVNPTPENKEKLIENLLYLAIGRLKNENVFSREPVLDYLNKQKKLDLLINTHVSKMLKTAIDVFYAKPDETLANKFRLNSSGLIEMKVGDRFVTDSLSGYYNSFFYLKYKFNPQARTIHAQWSDLNYSQFGYFSFYGGSLSYAKIPKLYTRIFGVTGTLKNLCPAEQVLLESNYQIKKFTYFPSFFNGSRIKEENSVHLLQSPADWAEIIVQQTRKYKDRNQAVLIFFENEVELDWFLTHYGTRLQTKPLIITENKITNVKTQDVLMNKDEFTQKFNFNDIDKLVSEQHAGMHGSVTLLTRIFGRGVDFKPEAIVNTNGGIHVIQAFFSLDIKEEVQIKGRTARKGDPGSYEIVICLENLMKNLDEGVSHFFRTITVYSNYQALDTCRQNLQQLLLKNKNKKIQDLEQEHTYTYHFFKAINNPIYDNTAEILDTIVNSNIGQKDF